MPVDNAKKEPRLAKRLEVNREASNKAAGKPLADPDGWMG